MIEFAIAMHFLFDWVLQPRVVARNKKKMFLSMMTHMTVNVAVYLAIISMVLVYKGAYWQDVCGFFVVNYVCHYFIDWLLPSGDSERKLINYTALDQVLHLVILTSTIRLCL